MLKYSFTYSTNYNTYAEIFCIKQYGKKNCIIIFYRLYKIFLTSIFGHTTVKNKFLHKNPVCTERILFFGI